MIRRLRAWRRRRTAEAERRYWLAVIRREFAWWGIDVSRLPDDELERHIQRGVEVMRSAGLTAAEASSAMGRIAAVAMNRYG